MRSGGGDGQAIALRRGSFPTGYIRRNMIPHDRAPVVAEENLDRGRFRFSGGVASVEKSPVGASLSTKFSIILTATSA